MPCSRRAAGHPSGAPTTSDTDPCSAFRRAHGAAERDGLSPPTRRARTAYRWTTPLQRGDVDGLRALVAGLGVEGNLRALSQRLEAVGVDAGVVDEEVLAALVRGDEAEALVVVEPLHGSGSHDFPPRPMCTANAEEAATATTAGAEHSVVERGAPDLNTTKRTARISDLPRHRWAGLDGRLGEQCVLRAARSLHVVGAARARRSRRLPI